MSAIDHLEDEIDQAQFAGQDWIRLPLDMAVSLRDQLRPLTPWSPDLEAANEAYQAKRRAEAQAVIKADLEAQRRRMERREASLEAALDSIREATS